MVEGVDGRRVRTKLEKRSHLGHVDQTDKVMHIAPTSVAIGVFFSCCLLRARRAERVTQRREGFCESKLLNTMACPVLRGPKHHRSLRLVDANLQARAWRVLPWL